MERHSEGYTGDHQDHEEVVALLRRGRDEILRDWVERVRDNITVQTGRDLEEPVLLDHMPHLFDSILDRLEYNRSRDDAVRLAAIHGANRRSDGYGVVETVTELFMFRRAIWVYLSTVDAPPAAMVSAIEQIDGMVDRSAIASLTTLLDPNARMMRWAEPEEDDGRNEGRGNG
jgi:hypothetical protein